MPSRLTESWQQLLAPCSGWMHGTDPGSAWSAIPGFQRDQQGQPPKPRSRRLLHQCPGQSCPRHLPSLPFALERIPFLWEKMCMGRMCMKENVYGRNMYGRKEVKRLFTRHGEKEVVVQAREE